MNIDLLGDSSSIINRYRSVLDIFNLKQMITVPTQVTKTSQTLIDHIITNQPSRITTTGVIPCGIVSDHDSPYACVNIRVHRYTPRYPPLHTTLSTAIHHVISTLEISRNLTRKLFWMISIIFLCH